MTSKGLFVIRPGIMKDACAIANLCGQLGYPATAADVERKLGHILNSADHALFVAENRPGVLAGWAHVHKYALLYAPPGAGLIADVGGLVVDQRFRRQGVGRKLVESIEKWARENGAAVTIRSNVTRPESHHFYQALGYVRSKEQATYLKPC